jgi:hypothetical protein
MFVMTAFATDSKKSMLQSATIKILVKLPRDMARQIASNFAQVRLKLGPMALDKLVK